MTGASIAGPIHGLLDRDGRLVEADEALMALHLRAGGVAGGVIAAPQVASLARLVRRLKIVVARGVIVADGDGDLDLWVRARPEGEGVRIAITGWSERPPFIPPVADGALREHDFRRATADAAWETDGALLLTALSPSLAAETGEPVQSFLGRPLTRLFALTEDAEGGLPILTALAGQTRFHGQPAKVRGSDAPLRLAGVPLLDGAGRFAGFSGSAARIEGAADHERSAAPSPDSAEAEAFGEQLGRALKQPLDRIITDADSIAALSDGPLRRSYADYAADIAVAGRHLLALIDDLVDLQAIERADYAPTLEEIDLADVARRAAGLLGVRAADAQVRIDRPATGEALIATGEFRRALQIMVNLIGNAIRYSPPGGMIWIRVEREGDLAVVVIADQGKGIAPEDQERIFAKFERVDPTEPGGTGLGLYIARRLARAMGGDIAVDSAPGQGARFMFTLKAK